MASTVHYSYHRGLRPIQVNGATQFTSDAVMTLEEPSISEGSEAVDYGSSTELSAAPAGTKCVRLQVEDGKVCRYKIVNNTNPSAVADSDSPAISGETILHLEEGWYVSLLSTS